MKNVSNDFKLVSKKIKQQDTKLTINNGELTVQEVHLMPVKIFNSMPISRLKARKEVIAKEVIYSFEGQLFKSIMQQIELAVKNAGEIKDKIVNFKYGLFVNKDYEYVDIGDFYIKDIEDDKNKEELTVTGYDKMLNFMVPFKQSELKLNYPCTVIQLLNVMCRIRGVELYSSTFYNSNLIITEDFFTAQEVTYRDVLDKIAQATLTTPFIKENKLYMCKISKDSIQTLDTSYLSNLVVNEKFGPLNALVLGRGVVEDNIESTNQTSIAANGRHELRFDENEIVDDKRSEIIDDMLKQIEGLEYYALESSNVGLMWLEPCDTIIAKDREESEYKSIYLKARVVINTGIKGDMEASIPEETNTVYKVTTKEEKKTLRVERMAKKHEGIIEDVIEEQTDTSNKLTEQQQTIDGFKKTVSEETQATTATFMELLNSNFLTAEQVESLVNGNSEDIVIIKKQLTETENSSSKIIEAIEKIQANGVEYLKNMLFTMNNEGLFIATSQDEFNAKYDNKGMYLYSYDEMIARYDKDGAKLKNLEITGELKTGNLRIMDVVVNGENRTHIHWIGG